MRKLFVVFSGLVIAGLLVAAWFTPTALWGFAVVGPLLVLGIRDYTQASQAIRRNFPLLGRFRYLFEAVRPEINQYFVESNTDGMPFNREQRSVVYQRAKKQLDTLPFGTQRDVYAEGYEWLPHSLAPTRVEEERMRVRIGGPDCREPYLASRFNISAMSYGSLSRNAILALNGGAKLGGFAHNTGEGGLSPYHLEPGGDLIWQIGTGYFSCRDERGGFSDERFRENARRPQVKMIEIKLSQGAKPSHGGILPAAKVTPEISAIRGVPMGRDVVSPPAHSAFDSPAGLLEFVARLRELSGGKPVGIKLCLGQRSEFMAVCKAMRATGITPDYIAVDGGEGGTGAAPLEFSNHVGYPGIDALIFVHNALVGCGLRDRIRVFNAGKAHTGFDLVKRFALGADVVYSARAMLLALGCIQALRCNTNHCPTGVATQDPQLVAGLVVGDKRGRVASFHHQTVEGARHLIEALGLDGPAALRPGHILRRMSAADVRDYGQLFAQLEPGELLRESAPGPGGFAEEYRAAYAQADAASFRARADERSAGLRRVA